MAQIGGAGVSRPDDPARNGAGHQQADGGGWDVALGRSGRGVDCVTHGNAANGRQEQPRAARGDWI